MWMYRLRNNIEMKVNINYYFKNKKIRFTSNNIFILLFEFEHDQFKKKIKN